MNNAYQKIIFKIQVLILTLKVKILGLKATLPNLGPPQKIIIHHGGGWLGFDLVNKYHEKLWGFKSFLGYHIGYQYFVDRHGHIIQGRLDTEEGAHTKGFNKRTIGVCLMGDGTAVDFTKEQYLSLEAFLEAKLEEYGLKKADVFGHRDFGNTACPSDILYKWLTNWKKI